MHWSLWFIWRECVCTDFCHGAFSHIAYLSRLTCFLSVMLINDLFTFYYDFLSQLWLIILFWLEHLLKEFKKTFFLFLCWRNIYIIDLKYLIQFLLLNIWKIPFLKDDVIALFVSLHYIQFDCLHCQLAFILVCFSQFFFFFLPE